MVERICQGSRELGGVAAPGPEVFLWRCWSSCVPSCGYSILLAGIRQLLLLPTSPARREEGEIEGQQ